MQSSNLGVEAPSAGRSPPAILRAWESWCTTRSTAHRPSPPPRGRGDANEKAARAIRAARAVKQDLQSPWEVLVNLRSWGMAVRESKSAYYRNDRAHHLLDGS